MSFREIPLIFALAATPLIADPLPEMAGHWTGSGTAREDPGGPEEAVRCRLDNAWQEDRRRLRVHGRCAVPGRTFEIDGALKEEAGGRLSGFWRNPDGPGQVTISGQIQDNAAYFAFRATKPGTDLDISQTVTLRIAADLLNFSARSRADNSEMADIEFGR